MGPAPTAARADLDPRLGAAWDLNRAGSTAEHVVVMLPSYGLSESLLEHFGPRLPSLEHRYLLTVLLLGRVPGCELVFVTSRAPDPAVLDYYAGLCPPAARDTVLRRLHVVVVPDLSHRSLATKLLEHPDLLARVRGLVAGRPAFIEPWNVTTTEVEVARRLGLPLLGTAPELWHLGFKGAGRRLLRAVGVPTAEGAEDVRDPQGVTAAVTRLRRHRPGLPAVVVKLDNACSGDGNLVLPLVEESGEPATGAGLAARVGGIPGWFLRDLRHGGVVEELLRAAEASSPSVQLEVTPHGTVRVLSTHEQVLDASGQVYQGCRLPANPGYAAELATHGLAVGQALAREGVLGRLSVDFMAVSDGAGWRLCGLEVNLRKGGTTHPFGALRLLVPGDYDRKAGEYRAEDGSPRCYVASDNLHDPAWLGLTARAVMDTVAAAGVHFDAATGTGVVLHMFDGLGVDGRLGLTAIGATPDHADRLSAATREAVDGLRSRRAGGR